MIDRIFISCLFTYCTLVAAAIGRANLPDETQQLLLYVRVAKYSSSFTALDPHWFSCLSFSVLIRIILNNLQPLRAGLSSSHFTTDPMLTCNQPHPLRFATNPTFHTGHKEEYHGRFK